MHYHVSNKASEINPEHFHIYEQLQAARKNVSYFANNRGLERVVKKKREPKN